MSEKCPFLEKCGFFNNFGGNSEVVKNGWITLYCQNKAKSEKCERKRIRAMTGKPPADNMAPNGQML